jgi:hypothetical protein
MRRHTRWPAWLPATLIVTGVLVIFLVPDQGAPRVFEFTPGQGPSFPDLVGFALVVAGLYPAIATILGGRKAIASYWRRDRFGMWYPFAFGLAIGLLLAGLFTDFPGWWGLGALLLFGLGLWAWRLVGPLNRVDGTTRPGPPRDWLRMN